MLARALQIQRSLYLVTAGLVAVAALRGAALPDNVQVALLIGGVALLGLPHGALDPLIMRSTGLARTNRQLGGFIALYATIASVAALLWWFAPVAALAVYLLMSIWHFRNDWRDELPALQRLLAAAATVGAPALFQPRAVSEIFQYLVFGADASVIAEATAVAGLCGIAGVVFSAARSIAKRLPLAVELLSLPLLAWFLPPILYFVVYFCALHSPRHLVETIAASKVSGQSMVVTGSVFTALAIAAGGLAYALIPGIDDRAALIGVVFIGLAALTVPHMILIETSKRWLRS